MDKYYERNPTTAAAVPLPLSGEARKLHPKPPLKGEVPLAAEGFASFAKVQLIFTRFLMQLLRKNI